jgi:hypothetical protein
MSHMTCGITKEFAHNWEDHTQERLTYEQLDLLLLLEEDCTGECDTNTDWIGVVRQVSLFGPVTSPTPTMEVHS